MAKKSNTAVIITPATVLNTRASLDLRAKSLYMPLSPLMPRNTNEVSTSPRKNLESNLMATSCPNLIGSTWILRTMCKAV